MGKQDGYRLGTGGWDGSVSGWIAEGGPAILGVIAQVNAAEEVMKKLPQVECPVTHHFSQGVYARQILIPKGTVLTGKIHKYPQLNICSKGELSVLTEDGVKRVGAGFHVVSPAGTKRIAYAHEDTIWTTIHGTEENDLEIIESYFIAQDDAEYLEHCRLLQIEDKS